MQHEPVETALQPSIDLRCIKLNLKKQILSKQQSWENVIKLFGLAEKKLECSLLPIHFQPSLLIVTDIESLPLVCGSTASIVQVSILHSNVRIAGEKHSSLIMSYYDQKMFSCMHSRWQCYKAFLRQHDVEYNVFSRQPIICKQNIECS